MVSAVLAAGSGSIPSADAARRADTDGGPSTGVTHSSGETVLWTGHGVSVETDGA